MRVIISDELLELLAEDYLKRVENGTIRSDYNFYQFVANRLEYISLGVGT